MCNIPSKLGITVALADPVGENRILLHFGYLPKGAVCRFLHLLLFSWKLLFMRYLFFSPLFPVKHGPQLGEIIYESEFMFLKFDVSKGSWNFRNMFFLSIGVVQLPKNIEDFFFEFCGLFRKKINFIHMLSFFNFYNFQTMIPVRILIKEFVKTP